jgi:uncharacterized membrane protein YeaQ/YmgE (transglycosylase-associated protein family)
MLMTVVWFIVIGAVIGALARLLIPGRNRMGILLTILVGIAGAVIGGIIANAVGAGNVLAFVFSVVIAAIVVALITGAGRWGGYPRRTAHDTAHDIRPAAGAIRPAVLSAIPPGEPHRPWPARPACAARVVELTDGSRRDLSDQGDPK